MESKKKPKSFLFGKQNYQILFAAFALVTLGYILMAGGGSDDPNIFNPEIFNFRRIRLAPTLVIFGFGIAIYAILAQDKKA
tara:strand:+ start:769 stop:1011 length:243 start_codon:yes stop_codon:yes gene_type:complete